ncbi:NAD(+) diphosphatase [Brachybacterium sp. JHP9]|uniref:NAD(+) diphosphatase n=1 Tax=Brachybacterium equifaecis TaxID=2910770 RepID=A0ABT0QWH4_9MICO|nr:NAD(+) diphosphatase [Brachybacterium equifaecis]MCL6421986.1 NAD(+) diphosphatase [Brachybacterium equifaecis]
MTTLRGPHLLTPLTRTGTDRDALRRAEPGILEPGPDARYVLTRGGAVAVAGAQELLLSRELPPAARDSVLVHLGSMDGLRCIGAEVAEPAAGTAAPQGLDLGWQELRTAGAHLEPAHLALALTAISMIAWHRSTRRCPACGEALVAQRGGWELRCTGCGELQFPRTDPAVIMAVRDESDRLLLARSARAQHTFHSVLAGFVEPGESIEAAVAREVEEEVSLHVESVEYVGSQPWPFPRSLMLGFRAWASSATPIVLADGEIASAQWVTREELSRALVEGAIALPGPASLGHALIADWYGAPLPPS